MEEVLEMSWPPEFETIDVLLKCGICYEYIETTVMTPCSHNYCSLCIRKYLHYKTQCPQCFQKTFETDLRTNRILDEIILQFNRVKAKFVKNNLSDVIDKNCEIQKIVSNSPSSSVSISPECKKTIPKLANHHQTSKISTNFLSLSPSCSKDKSCKQKPQLVACPVCTVDIPQMHVNKHLDECLKRDSIPIVSSRVQQKRKPLPKLVVNLMKDSELKKKIKELGLSIQGDRKSLEKRLQRYSILYNAECDKPEPRSITELLKQCKDEEVAEKKMLNPTANWLKISRNSEQNKIDEANKQYLAMNADSYTSLINSLKTRQEPRNLLDKTTDMRASINQITMSPNTSINKKDSNEDIFDQSTDESSDSDAHAQEFCDNNINFKESPKGIIAETNCENRDIIEGSRPTRKRTRPSRLSSQF